MAPGRVLLVLFYTPSLTAYITALLENMKWKHVTNSSAYSPIR